MRAAAARRAQETKAHPLTGSSQHEFHNGVQGSPTQAPHRVISSGIRLK